MVKNLQNLNAFFLHFNTVINRMLREGKFQKYTALYGRRRLILRREFEKYLEENPEVKEGLLNGRKSKVTA